jgi:AAA domain
VIDTLNRSLFGSENRDEDMGAYIRAADAIREALGCTVAIIHHCGVAGDRPRGHTSLTGAVDAQLAVKRDANIITVKVEWLKDGQEGAEIVSRLEKVKLGADSYGDPIESCVVVADDPMARLMATPAGQFVRPAVANLKSKAKLGLDQLHECIAEIGREAPDSPPNIPVGARGVTLDEWRDRLGKAAVINVKGNPREEFKRIREDLQSAKLIGVLEGFMWLA